jgi:hypothetical protein
MKHNEFWNSFLRILRCVHVSWGNGDPTFKPSYFFPTSLFKATLWKMQWAPFLSLDIFYRVSCLIFVTKYITMKATQLHLFLNIYFSGNLGSSDSAGRREFDSRQVLPCLDRFWGPFSILSNRYLWPFPRGQSCRGVKLITHVHLQPRLRVCGAIPLLSHAPYKHRYASDLRGIPRFLQADAGRIDSDHFISGTFQFIIWRYITV